MTAAVEGRALRLLVIEDSDDDFEILLRELRRGGYKPSAHRVASASELTAALSTAWDLAISDWLMPGFGGERALAMIAERKIDLPCIVISGTPSEEAAVAALHGGALDFMSKDKPLRFVPAVERALRETADRRARVAAERELRLSEARHRTSFEIAPEALLTYDLEAAKVIEANPAAQRLFGYTQDEIRKMALGELSPPTQPDGRASFEAGREVIARSGREPAITFEWTYRTKSGELVPTETHHARLPTDTGQLARVTIVDLRERRRIEAMRRRALELELQNRRIQEANRLKSEFLANMSHELRTPLNAIIGFSELLHDGAVDPRSSQHKEFLGDILASGRHLLQLINDVLDLAKVEAGKVDFRPEPIELSRVLGEVVSITRTAAAAKRIVVRVEISDEVATGIYIDPGRLKQVAYNYLSNALKFTPDGGAVTIRALPDGPLAFRLEVEDTGPGIAPSDLGQLFVEFQQLEAGTAKRHQGTGLGLALTRRLVEAQAGSVGVRSTPGKGSVFHVVLPRRASVAAAPAPPAPIVAAPPRNGPRTVLIVEDNDRDRSVIGAALIGEGINIDVARTGGEALTRCREHAYDAVTLDLLLPDMSGLDLLAALRAEVRTRATPIVVVSVAADADLVAAFAVTDVLRKPLDRDGLMRALERAGVRPELTGGVLVVDDDDSALKLMETALAQLGYNPITRANGEVGLLAAHELRPSAVILDLMMPTMDGFEFLARFRQFPEHARTPVLVWTMKDLTTDEHALLKQTAQGVLSKQGGSPSTVVEQLRLLVGGHPGGE